MNFSLFSAVVAATVAVSSLALAQGAAPPRVARSVAGDLLVDSNGMTLYAFSKDQPGKSACNGGCAANWPPVKASRDAAAAGAFSVVTRDDGSQQWAYMGRPLYTWVKDQKPGDMTGDGFLNGASGGEGIPCDHALPARLWVDAVSFARHLPQRSAVRGRR